MKTQKLTRILGILIVLACFYFIFRLLYTNWYSVKTAHLQFQWFYLVFSFFFMFITLILTAFSWKKNLAMLSENISLSKALQINALATLPKYVPGKIWGIAGKIYLAKKENISEHNCVITVTLETILSLLGGAILFLITTATQLKWRVSTYYLLLIPVCFIIIYPQIFIRVTNFFLKLSKRPMIDIMPSYFQIIILLALYTLSWILQGIGVFFLINSFYKLSPKFILSVAGLHAFSWVMGFLSIITPAGLGVKEGIFSYFLSFILPSGIAAITAILVRIWGTIGEIFYFLIYLRSLKKYL
ncbi:MAG: lysylphosphatidylglycerol synthase transmembrane domain-containing protein [candidate division WOR-3 bacterium]